MKKYNGIECWDEIHKEMAEEIKSNGIEYVGRSLGELHRKETDVLLNAGLKIVSIWESSADYAGYFREERGYVEGRQAFGTAQLIGQPEGSAIYFPVHFDAQPSHMNAILSYFLGVREGLGKKYKVGVYGSNVILKMLHRINIVDCYWRCSGWPYENTVGFLDNGSFSEYQIIEGIPFKFHYFSNGTGSWGLNGCVR